MRERAVRMVHETIAESGERVGAVTRVARQLGITPESLRSRVKQAEIDTRPASTEEVVRFISAHRERWGVEPICRALQVAPSAYYAAVNPPLSARRQRDE